MALEKIRPRVVDETGNYTFNNVTATGSLISGNANIANITGVANLIASQATITLTGNLSTDSNISAGNIKTNNLLYANGNPWSIGASSTPPGGSTTQIQFNDAGSFAGSSSFTFNKSTNTLAVSYISANGSQLTGLVASSITGQVANALLAGTVYTNAQPNITSVGTLTSLDITGNVTSGNATLGNATTSNYFIGNGSLLSSITGGNVTGQVAYAAVANSVSGSNVQGQVTYAATANAVSGGNVLGQVGNALIASTVYTNAQPNITSVGTLANLSVSGNVAFSGANVSLGNVSNLHVSGGTSGYVLQTDGSGNLSWVSAGAAFQSSGGISIGSTISNIIAGAAIDVSVSYADPTYPGGKYTIAQLGPVTFSTTDVWYTGSATKNAYSNAIAGTVNTQNVNVTFSLANATFDVKSGDYINIGSSTVTGANLLALNINGNGTYTIPSAYLTVANTQTNSTVAVTANLTTSRGAYLSTGTSLTNNQYVAFNVTALSGTFTSSTVPYWSLNQTFNWNATTSSGATVASGNVTYANVATSISGSLTSAGATSGTSASLDSTMNYTITATDYYGAGQYGAGSRSMTATVTGTVTAATKYYPLFYKITTNSTIPTFTTSDSHGTANIVIGTTYANTNTTPSDYLWMATPTSASRTFKHIYLGSDIIDTPNATGDITISGQAYKVWGFTTFSQVASIIITS